jgi:site-specific DNA recombinase
MLEMYRRELKKVGVEVISITQEVDPGPGGDMMRTFLATFDEYQSRETSKHTSRAMKANAAAGFWNGSRPPFGYEAVEAERRGMKIKKKLARHDADAEIVQLIYQLYLEGADEQGPTGLVAIAAYLNDRGTTCRGKKFQRSNIYDILTRRAYTGKHRFNQRSAGRNGSWKPPEEWVEFDVPQIIDLETFEAVQIKLHERQATKTAPRVAEGPTLLTGLLKCAGCTCEKSAGMTLRTGKGGAYRYYTCSRKIRFGAGASKAKDIRVEKLDEMILTEIENRILQPDRLKDMLGDWLAHDATQELARLERLARLKAKRTETEGGLSRLFALIEKGLADPDNPVFAAKLRETRARLATQTAELKSLTLRAAPSAELTDEKVEAFAKVMQAKLRGPDPKLRQVYVRLMVDKIDVHPDKIEIRGSKAALAAAIKQPESETGKVRSFVLHWCGQEDSNFHELSPTATSTLRVYQFRHGRTPLRKAAV